jgi:hypothetical protein
VSLNSRRWYAPASGLKSVRMLGGTGAVVTRDAAHSALKENDIDFLECQFEGTPEAL